MNSIFQFLSTLINPATNAVPTQGARDLLERATTARGQSVFEAAELRANAQAMLSVLR